MAAFFSSVIAAGWQAVASPIAVATRISRDSCFVINSFSF
jgi:hypothetical protein